MKKKISDIVAEFLVKKGFSHAFGVTGGGAMHLNDSFSNNKKIKFIHTHHEQTAAMAADSYFRQKRVPAIVHTTSGPGGTNAITGVIGSWVDSFFCAFLSAFSKVFKSSFACLWCIALMEIKLGFLDF